MGGGGGDGGGGGGINHSVGSFALSRKGICDFEVGKNVQFKWAVLAFIEYILQRYLAIICYQFDKFSPQIMVHDFHKTS